jgi:alpha-galactosidase
MNFICAAVAVLLAATTGARAADATNSASYILTPPDSPKPAIHSAKVFGARPGSPFLYTVVATGDRPMTFSAVGLPAGLKLDGQTGQITGALANAGSYNVTLRAKNKRGTAERKLAITCGPLISLTPALGWNSWNCFGASVTAAKVRAAADTLVSSGLANHGWTYINIDDFWEVNPQRGANDPTLAGPERDAAGRILPNPRFADMKGLVDHIHSLGLKAGIYSSPGPTTCGGCVGSYQHEELDAQQYADWGIDYLKYDWCSYANIANNEAAARFAATNTAPPDTNAPAGRRGGRGQRYTLIHDDNVKPYRVMHEALAKVPRDIVFSLCQYGNDRVFEWGADVGGTSWRTSGDIQDNWRSLSANGFRLGGHEKYVNPGHYDDPDMMVLGVLDVGSGRNLHPARLTPDEQYTHMSLWCLLASPLLLGCDLTRLDDFTLSLLRNDEVLAVDQDTLCHQASRVFQDSTNQVEVWSKALEDGTKAVGLFNRSDAPTTVTARWTDLGVTGKQVVRDLWRQKDLGKFQGEFQAMVPRHGVVLVKIGRGN